jgi:hypothetical protein
MSWIGRVDERMSGKLGARMVVGVEVVVLLGWAVGRLFSASVAANKINMWA